MRADRRRNAPRGTTTTTATAAAATVATTASVITLVLMLVACKPWGVSTLKPSHRVLIVPLSLEAHALTARRCAYRGVVDSVCGSCKRFRQRYNPLTHMRWSADLKGANAVVLVRAVSRITAFNHVVTGRAVKLEGKAVFCAPPMLRRLARLSGASSAGPSSATPSSATPSNATPSSATPSSATPSSATPSSATPSSAPVADTPRGKK